MTITTEDGILNGFMPAVPFFKAISANRAVGYPHVLGFVSPGFPDVFTPATPGLSGATVDGTTSTLGGTLYFANPPAGQSTYLAKIAVSFGSSIVGIQFFDLLWYNTGIVVTSTTAQTINSITLPPRDMNGAPNGVGVFPWLYTQTATTNASTITISYTNSNGVSGRTGSGLLGGGQPATANAGTLIPFGLQIGDVGVQSIQTITLGTSLAAGSVSLVLIRNLTYIGIAQALAGFLLDSMATGFPQLYNGTALSFWVYSNATTVGTVFGNINYSQG